jgi:DNA-binding CsgD family transcriptional regulator/Tfp pilus assembly protein PilF
VSIGERIRPRTAAPLAEHALIERDVELRELDRALTGALEGEGAVVLVEAAAGKGKTSLLAAARDRAHEHGMRTLHASGKELEREFPFGAAIQLFEPLWAAADDELRARLATGPARHAVAMLEAHLDEPPERSDQGYAVIRGFFSLACNWMGSWTGSSPSSPLTKSENAKPVGLIVDDAQWLDRASLRFLAYVAARIGALPLALLVAMRPIGDAADTPELVALRHADGATVLRPSSLTGSGVRTLIRSRFPDADGSFIASCTRITKGNPFLLRELLGHIEADGRPADADTAERLSDLVPEAIINAVVARLGAISAPARALAAAVAALGDRVALQDAARVAELDSRTAADAAEALADAHLLGPAMPLSFTHPLIRSAVLQAMSPLARGRVHRRAAEVLREAGAGAESIAAHLLAAPADSDPTAVEELRVAARRNLRSGDARTAVRLLERALHEQPQPDQYPDVLAELGQAEAQAGRPRAPQRLEEAINVVGEPGRRAELSLTHGQLLAAQHSYRDAASAFDAGRRELDGHDPTLAGTLDAAYVAAAALVPELVPEALERRRRMLEGLAGEPDEHKRLAIAHSVIQDGLRGTSRDEIRGLVERAWGDGSLLRGRDYGHDIALYSLTSALLMADELERGLEICELAGGGAGEETGPAAAAAGAIVSNCKVWLLYEQGRIAEAAAQARIALDAPDHVQTNVRTAYGALACCRLQRGELDGAEEALGVIDDDDLRETIRYPALLEMRAQLRLAQHRPDEALADAVRAGELLEQQYGVGNPAAAPWRSTAALAELARGNQDRAEELAAEEFELAQRIGVTRVVIRDLRVLGLAVGGAKGIELLEQAAGVASECPVRLESMLAHADLGAALRRAKKRAAARDPLRRALELAHRHGARAIAERAQTELAATGARPRRLLLTGIESLTPSERRVAELAAQGMTTRLVAETLFITPKTVEYHLRHVYQKLDVRSRAELTDVMRGERAA